MCGPMKNPEVDTRSRVSNLGPLGYEADALPHEHRHHTFIDVFLVFWIGVIRPFNTYPSVN